MHMNYYEYQRNLPSKNVIRIYLYLKEPTFVDGGKEDGVRSKEYHRKSLASHG